MAAVHDAARTGSDELCWDLATTATLLFEVRSYYDDWRDVHNCALAAARAAGNRRGEATALVGLGALLDQAATHLQQALDIARELDVPLLAARALHNLGVVHDTAGRPGATSAAWREALALFTDLDDPDAQQVAARLRGQHRHDLASS